jgi:hypothetical protein
LAAAERPPNRREEPSEHRDRVHDGFPRPTRVHPPCQPQGVALKRRVSVKAHVDPDASKLVTAKCTVLRGRIS